LQNQRRDDQHVAVSFDDRPPGTAASGIRRPSDEVVKLARSKAADSIEPPH